MKRLILGILLILLLSRIWAQDLQFFREDLEFEIRANNLLVSGHYYFRNQSSEKCRQTLYYPFPQSEIYGRIDSVFAFSCRADSTSVLLSQNEQGAFFEVEIEPDSEAIYQVGYRQKLLANTAEYILISTSTWQQPFAEVNYSLIFPKNLQLLSLSYLPDDLSENEQEYRLHWHKENFLPRRNFIIEFQQQP